MDGPDGLMQAGGTFPSVQGTGDELSLQCNDKDHKLYCVVILAGYRYINICFHAILVLQDLVFFFHL